MIKQITSDEFHARYQYRGAIGFHVEREWWASESGHILGTVIRDKIDNDWSAVLVGADQHGEYRAFDMAHSMPDITAARQWLHQAMTKAIRLGQAVFPQ